MNIYSIMINKYSNLLFKKFFWLLDLCRFYRRPNPKKRRNRKTEVGALLLLGLYRRILILSKDSLPQIQVKIKRPPLYIIFLDLSTISYIRYYESIKTYCDFLVHPAQPFSKFWFNKRQGKLINTLCVNASVICS